MAIVNLNPPVYVLFDYLLASSWAWFALCLATIATTLRALRLHLLRRRLLTLAAEAASPPTPTALPPSPPAFKPQPCAVNPHVAPASPPRNLKRRARSKSASALEKLPAANQDGFWVPGCDFLSSVFDSELSSSLKKIVSASRFLCGQDGRAASEINGEEGSDGEESGATEKYRVPVYGRGGWKPQCEVQTEESMPRLWMEEGACAKEEACASWWLPSWALSMCSPSQPRWSSTFHVSKHAAPPYLVSPCFEKQFGWDRLLESKSGFPWRCPPGGPPHSTKPSLESRNVVRMWSGTQKKVLSRLNLDEQSTLALDACVPEGLACTGNVAGKFSVWELNCSTTVRTSATFVNPVLSVSMNWDRRTTVVGTSATIGLWDQRSPSLDLHCTSWPLHSTSSMRSRGNGLCVRSEDGTLSIYDLRKLHGGKVAAGMMPTASQNAPAGDDESEVWGDLLGGDMEEEIEDDCSWMSTAGTEGVGVQKGNSMVSRLATFVRAVTLKST